MTEEPGQGASQAEEPAAGNDLDLSFLQDALAARRIGRRLILVDEVASTMDRAQEAGRRGEPDGTVVIADFQSAGRGRLGRQWLAPRGTALLVSVLFRPRIQAALWGQLAMAVGLGALQAVRALRPGRPAALKWPNDILLGKDKLGGLLAESRLLPPDRGELVVGLGLNVHQRAADLPPGATSLAREGVSARRDQLAAAVLLAVDDRYGLVRSGGSLLSEWTANLATLGRDVVATSPSGVLRGRAVAVEPDGALVIVDPAGRRTAVRAGDVSLSE